MRPIDVLLVEDNPGDVVLTRRAFEDSKVLVALHVVTDGQQALDFVRKEGSYTDAPRPDLILLDINLPRVDGFEVLQELKDTEAFRDIPIVMLTSSEQDRDILRSYKSHANSYIAKPPTLGGLASAVQDLSQYWFALVRRPEGPTPE